MTFDVGALSGLLGIVLTIVFFVVGYRQTIGARKERAGAVNREVTEILLRRLLLDAKFNPNIDTVEQLLKGKALEHRVRLADIYPIDSIFLLLHSNVLGNDYVQFTQRQLILKKINKCLGELEASSKATSETLSKGARRRLRDGQFPVEIILGIASGLMAILVNLFATRIFIGEISDKFKIEFLVPFLGGLILVTLTVIVLVVAVRLRDRTTPNKQTEFPPSVSESKDFELRFVHRLQREDIDFVFQNREIDLIVLRNEGRVAVEIRYKILSKRFASHLVSRVKIGMEKYECNKGYIVTKNQIDSAHDPKDPLVQIVTAEEFLRIIKRNINLLAQPGA
jgi:hypothetical protein